VYFYGIGVPALLWGATKWLKVGEWGVAEALGVYGYAMTVFVPISLLCLIPVGILRWALVGAAAASSGYFLYVQSASLRICPLTPQRSQHLPGPDIGTVHRRDPC
jgi:hypothetical protein